MLSFITQRVWPTLYRTVDEWSSDDGNRLAASMAYYGVLSFFPLLLVLLSIFAYASKVSPALQLNLIEWIRVQTASKFLAEQVESVLKEVQSQAVVGGPLGAIGILLA